MVATSYADVVAGVRATMAAYAHALDDGRTDDVVDTFCPDGVCELPGMGTHEGHDAIRAAFSGWKPVKPQRHVVVNTLVTDWDAEQARATSDLVFLVKGEAGWRVQMVGRYVDELRVLDGRWRFRRRVATFA